MMPAIQNLEKLAITTCCLLLLWGCEGNNAAMTSGDGHDAAEEEVVARGPNNGRLLEDNGFVVELAIFETGVPPEFRAWASMNGTPVPPDQWQLDVELTRLGDVIDKIGFAPQGDALHGGVLRGDTVIYEPHSFAVDVYARYQGKNYHWQYDSFEGRTQIEPAVAEALGIETELAGQAVIEERIKVYGRAVPYPQNVRQIRARFEGVLKSVNPALGERVRAGQILAVVESNDSLRAYEISAPISGIVIQRNANPGEQTGGRELLTLVDTSSLWVELDLFPKDLGRVEVGDAVYLTPAGGDTPIQSTVQSISPTAQANQTVKARVLVDNEAGRLLPGAFVSAEVVVDEHEAPLAVKRSGLQAFRDFTVVYAKIGDQYEVRMLDLGRQSAEWAEVLGGLPEGTRYVTENSFVIKADIEKSGASHDH